MERRGCIQEILRVQNHEDTETELTGKGEASGERKLALDFDLGGCVYGRVIHQSRKCCKSSRFDFSFIVIYFKGLVGHPGGNEQCSRVYRSVASKRVLAR